MTTKFHVSTQSEDTSTYARKTHIRVGTSGDLSFDAPFKTGVGGVTNSPLYEAYKKVKPETISRCLEHEKTDRVHGSELKRRCKGKFNILFLEYDSKNEIPTEKMVEALSDMQYFHTDIIATPSWFDLITQKNGTDVELYLDLSETFISAAMTRNHKPIMATIPQSIPPSKLENVLKYYINKEITSFVVDSHGRTLLNGSWLRTFQRTMSTLVAEYKLEKECVMYSINSFQGIVKKNEQYVEAKDFLNFATGFDILGGKHTAKFFKGNDDKPDSTMGRVFDPETYNYVKVPCNKDDKKLIDDESVIKQINEMHIVRENIDDHDVYGLLSSKRLSKDTLKKIASLKDKPKTTLDQYI